MKKEGKKVILEQIEENKKIRQKQKELENKERLELLKRIEDENKKAQELAQMKKKENEKRIKESLEANHQAILIKQQRILAEREQDKLLEQYNKEKYKVCFSQTGDCKYSYLRFYGSVCLWNF